MVRNIHKRFIQDVSRPLFAILYALCVHHSRYYLCPQNGEEYEKHRATKANCGRADNETGVCVRALLSTRQLARVFTHRCCVVIAGPLQIPHYTVQYSTHIAHVIVLGQRRGNSGQYYRRKRQNRPQTHTIPTLLR